VGWGEMFEFFIEFGRRQEMGILMNFLFTLEILETFLLPSTLQQPLPENKGRMSQSV
jgi:hypothetical protein